MRTGRAIAAVGFLVIGVSACGGSANVSVSTSTRTPAASSAQASPEAKHLNACDYFSVDDATALMEEPMKVQGAATYSSVGNATTCSYVGASSADTLTLQMGGGSVSSLASEQSLFKGTSVSGYGDAAYWVNRAGAADFAMVKGSTRLDVFLSHARMAVEVSLSKEQKAALQITQKAGI